jgi:hypothetical protein
MLRVATVARRAGDAGALDVAEVNGSACAAAFGREPPGFSCCSRVEGHDASFEILVEGAAEGALEIPFPATCRGIPG